MGVPTSTVGYTSAMPRREDHEVRKGHVGHWIKKKISLTFVWWDSRYSMRKDRDGERIKLTVGFRNCFANAPKIIKFLNSGDRLVLVME